MKRVKMVVSDYDGTIYTEDGKTLENVAAIRRWHEGGGKFVIATGRGVASAQRIIEEYGVPFDYCIMNNGAIVVDAEFRPLLELTMPEEVVREIADFVRERFAGVVEGVYYYGSDDKSETPDSTMTKMRVQTKGKGHEAMNAVADAINERFPRVVAHATSTDMYPEWDFQIVDIGSREAGKEHAIQFVLEREGLSADVVVTVGDGMNDVGMLRRYGGYAIAGSMAEREVRGRSVTSVAALLDELDSAKG